MRKLTLSLLVLATLVAFLFYVTASLTPYIAPYNFWSLTFLAIAFPFIAACYFLLMLSWLLFNRKIAAVLLLVFFCGYKNLTACFAFRLPSNFKYEKDAAHLRVLSWNIRFFENPSKYADSATAPRRRMLNFIKSSNADVLLLQEFREIENPAIFSNVQVLRDTLGYKYFYLGNDFKFPHSYGTSYEGCAIFSKQPLVDSGKALFPSLPNGESVMFADVLLGDKTLRLFTAHLLSMSLFVADEIEREGKFINRNRLFNNARARFDTIHFYDSIHARQAQFYRQMIEKSPHPVIASGDFNSLPTSYVYHTICGNLQDAFLQKGSGFGQSYIALSPTLRIDYILCDPKFKITQTATPAYSASDHFPVITDIAIR